MTVVFSQMTTPMHIQLRIGEQKFLALWTQEFVNEIKNATSKSVTGKLQPDSRRQLAVVCENCLQRRFVNYHEVA